MFAVKSVDLTLDSHWFYNTVIEVIVAVAEHISVECGIRNVAMSGGVFQNSYIFEGAYDRLVSQGFNVLTHINVPCNNAYISLGQAFLLRERLKAGLALAD